MGFVGCVAFALGVFIGTVIVGAFLIALFKVAVSEAVGRGLGW